MLHLKEYTKGPMLLLEEIYFSDKWIGKMTAP